MKPLGKAAAASGKAVDGTRRASTAAFGRVVGDAAPGRPTRLESHPGGVRLGQTPGGGGLLDAASLFSPDTYAHMAFLVFICSPFGPR